MLSENLRPCNSTFEFGSEKKLHTCAVFSTIYEYTRHISMISIFVVFILQLLEHCLSSSPLPLVRVLYQKGSSLYSFFYLISIWKTRAEKCNIANIFKRRGAVRRIRLGCRSRRVISRGNFYHNLKFFPSREYLPTFRLFLLAFPRFKWRIKASFKTIGAN